MKWNELVLFGWTLRCDKVLNFGNSTLYRLLKQNVHLHSIQFIHEDKRHTVRIKYTPTNKRTNELLYDVVRSITNTCTPLTAHSVKTNTSTQRTSLGTLTYHRIYSLHINIHVRASSLALYVYLLLVCAADVVRFDGVLRHYCYWLKIKIQKNQLIGVVHAVCCIYTVLLIRATVSNGI